MGHPLYKDREITEILENPARGQTTNQNKAKPDLDILGLKYRQFDPPEWKTI